MSDTSLSAADLRDADLRDADVRDEIDEMGPIDYLVIEFPEDRATGEGLPLLVDLVERRLIRVLDLVFVRKDTDGNLTVLTGADAPGGGSLDLSLFEGASSGLLGEDDLAEAGSVLEPGTAAGILVFENTWAGPFASAIRRGGGRIVASGRIPVQSVLGAIDDLERLESGA